MIFAYNNIYYLSKSPNMTLKHKRITKSAQFCVRTVVLKSILTSCLCKNSSIQKSNASILKLISTSFISSLFLTHIQLRKLMILPNLKLKLDRHAISGEIGFLTTLPSLSQTPTAGTPFYTSVSQDISACIPRYLISLCICLSPIAI